MSEGLHMDSEKHSEINELSIEKANRLADEVENAFVALNKVDGKNIIVENNDGSKYYFGITSDSYNEKDYEGRYKSKFSKTSIVAVTHIGPELQERFYFKVLRPDFYKYEDLSPVERNKSPELVPTGSKDFTVQLYDRNQKVIGEFVCIKDSCINENAQVLEGKTQELISILRTEFRRAGIEKVEAERLKIDRAVVIENSRAEQKKLADEIEE